MKHYWINLAIAGDMGYWRAIQHRVHAAALLCSAVGLYGCGVVAYSRQTGQSLSAARRGFTTHLTTRTRNTDPIPPPPAGIELVKYHAPLGDFAAYIATGVAARIRRPAIIWLVGGFDNGIGDTAWRPASPDNDQSARAFRAEGIITMYPSLRGGNSNPGWVEGDYGEVDDVIAAARYLASRPDVDPKRIYLGGHSTGGTLALLAAESTNRFRAVFAFGPVASFASYGPSNCTFDSNNETEMALRSPYYFLRSVVTPTYVFEGTDQPSNIQALQAMSAASTNPMIHFYELLGMTHFSSLAAITPIIARQVASDTGPLPRFQFLGRGEPIQPALLKR